MSKEESKEVSVKVILKIGDIEHSLTLEELKTLGLVIDSIITKQNPNPNPNPNPFIFPNIPAPPAFPNWPWRLWDIVYCGDTTIITKTEAK